MIRNDNRARFQSVVIYPAKEEQLSANEAGELRKKWSSEPSELWDEPAGKPRQLRQPLLAPARRP